MLEKLQKVEDRFGEIESQLGDPSVIADVDRFTKLTRELAALEPVIQKFRQYKKILAQIDEDKILLETAEDDELKNLAAEELAELKKSKAELDSELPILLLPRDPNDEKNVIVEIRGGVGGEEAALFVGDLFRMYARYAERQGWRVDIVDSNPTTIGGFKEISFTVDGAAAYSRLKYESGTHRVQRVPVTESSGRIHTSAVTVAVLPEAEEVDVEINPADLRIDTYCASGAGGQYVNKTESAIRITHIPSGIVVQCQDEKSQLKNKEKAMRVLRARVRDLAVREQNEAIAADRKNQVGSGDRSERIRTYNFPQGRVTDHRINLTLYKLESVLNGDLDEIISALITADQSKKLSLSNENF
ncbi:MAG: peptide chain release factor 1 [Selenomonadaceae bacterium]|nr:peptide chain release factor 1 [Selenomonadaceae bacterium]